MAHRDREPLIVRARAPVRVDFAGGWTDVPLFASAEGGIVVNAALALHVLVECRTGGGTIRLRAEDVHEHVTVKSSTGLVYDGKLDLHKAALNMMPVSGGIEVLTRSDVPAGSGLGASGALDVALLGALARVREEVFSPAELAEMGFYLEARELGLEGGRQDQLAAAHGGWMQLAFAGEDGVERRSLDPDPEHADALAATMVLAYTGHSHFSAKTHRRVWDSYQEGAADVVDALRIMRDVAGETADALRAGDWPRLGALMDENWRQQRRLDVTIATDAMGRVEDAARSAGAWGLKATGAGAGGCLLAVAPPGRVADVARAVEAAGAEVLPVAFDFEGLTVWEGDEADVGDRA